MSRGQRDYGMYAATAVTAGVSDIGELAARMGSVVVFDRRGIVMHFDNFEDPLLKWVGAPVALTEYAKLDSTCARSGSQAVILSNADPDTPTLLTRKVFPLASLSIGAEISLYFANDESNFRMDVIYFDGVNDHTAIVLINPVTKKLLIYDDTLGANVEIADTGELLTAGLYAFHTVKVVADFATDKYKRIMFNANEYDISAYSLDICVNPVAKGVITQINNTTRTPAVQGIFHVDDWILTQDEP